MKLLRYILIGLAAAGFALAAGAVLLFNRPTFGWQLLSVPTSSMRPTMNPGSLVLTHRVPLSSLKVGDVITHTNPLTMRTTLTHRIIKEYKIDGKIPAFVTKGDANPSPDPPVVGGLVQGRMVGHVPYVGELFMWAKTWPGIIVLIYVPALIIMVQETRRLAAYLKLTKPYYLEGWSPPKRGDHTMPTIPAVAAGAAAVLVIVVVGAGWTVASAFAPPSQRSTLLVIPHNLVSAETTTTNSTESSPTHPVSQTNTQTQPNTKTNTPRTLPDCGGVVTGTNHPARQTMQTRGSSGGFSPDSGSASTC